VNLCFAFFLGPSSTPKSLARHAAELSVLVSDTADDQDEDPQSKPPKRKHRSPSREKVAKKETEPSRRANRPPSLDIPHEAVDVVPRVLKARNSATKSAENASKPDAARKKMRDMMSETSSSSTSEYVSPKADRIAAAERDFEPNNSDLKAGDDLRLYKYVLNCIEDQRNTN
jgi:hypothetical protein